MALPEQWAMPEDFATLFQYFWHRDFPVDQRATGAKRADWTIHIGVVIRSIADLMGLKTRFESGGRTDAVLRSWQGDEIAVEWEWEVVWGNELDKLKDRKVWGLDKPSDKKLKYAVLIAYTHTPNIQKVYTHVEEKWVGARWPLLLVLIDFEDSKKFSMRREFGNIQISLLESNVWRPLKVSPALPWKIEDAVWSGRTLK
jgi:hypothetical protein